MGIIDKFELICHDIFDKTLEIPEKVDCVVLCYTLATFICDYDMLLNLFKICASHVKDDGLLFVSGGSWVNLPGPKFWCGMYYELKGEEKTPKEFERFKNYISSVPNDPYEISHLPNHVMLKAGYEAGFPHIQHLPQYPDPRYKNDKVIRRYLDECNPSDYLMKFKFVNP